MSDLLEGLDLDAPDEESADVSVDVADMGVTDGAEDDAPPSDTPDDAQAVEGEPATAAAEGVGQPPVVEPEPVPFAVNVWGQPYALPGSTFNAAARSIAFADDKAFDRARQLLTKGREYETRGRQELVQARQELQRIQNEPDAEKETAKVFMEEYRRLMEMSEDELGQFLATARQQWPVIQGRAERAYAERVLQHARTVNAPPEMDIDTVVEKAQDEVAQFIQQELANEAWATPEVLGAITEMLQDEGMLNQFVLKLGRDRPDLGLRAGQWAMDWSKAGKLLSHLATPYQRAATATQAATARATTTQSVAEANAKSLARAKPTTPPKSPATPAPKPRPRPQDVVRDAMELYSKEFAR